MYTKTNWVDNTTPIDKTNLNKIEQGIYDNSIRIETQVVTTANTDLNDYKENGEYYFDVDRAPINRPTGSNGWLKVINQTKNGAIKQLWFRQGTANANDYETYVRTLTGGTWSDWKLYTVDKGTGKLVKATQRTQFKWMKVCNVNYRTHSPADFFNLKLFIGDGYNGNANQDAYIDLICQLSVANSNGGRFGCKGILHPLLTNFTPNNTQIKIIANSNIDYDIWFYTSQNEFCFPNYIAYGSNLVTVTPKFELSDTAPTGTECNMDYSMFDDNMYYKSGETVTVKNGKMCVGDITGGAKDLRFELTLDKKLTNITSVSFTSLNITIRGIAGYVVSDSSGVQIVNNSEYSIVRKEITSENTILVDVQKTTAVSTTNNTPITVYINACTMTLT